VHGGDDALSHVEVQRHGGVKKVRRRKEEAQRGERRDRASDSCRKSRGAAGAGKDSLEKVADKIKIKKIQNRQHREEHRLAEEEN